MTAVIDFRELLGRLDFGSKTGRDVTFSPAEAWLLREHVRLLTGGPWDDPPQHDPVNDAG